MTTKQVVDLLFHIGTDWSAALSGIRSHGRLPFPPKSGPLWPQLMLIMHFLFGCSTTPRVFHEPVISIL